MFKANQGKKLYGRSYEASQLAMLVLKMTLASTAEISVQQTKCFLNITNIFINILHIILKDAMGGFASVQIVYFMLWVDLYRAWS